MYIPLESSTLDEIYTAADIPRTNPSRRARFLAEYVPLTMDDHVLIMRTAFKQRKCTALNMLESMATTR
jgi:hypothetical protein